MGFTDIALEKRDRIAWITLSRPRELNAMGPRMIAELSNALRDVADDPGTACVVVRGEGRAFCAGADLKFVADLPGAEREVATMAFLREAGSMMSALEALPKPVVAMVNGVATAGGLELVLCCDLVVAAEGARLGDGHSNYGLLPGAGASIRLTRRIGLARAKYLFYTGELLTARELMDAGLVNAVVPETDLLGAVEALLAKLVVKSPLGLGWMKSLANGALEGSLDDGLARELSANAEYMASFDRNEGLAAFGARRAPAFLGR